MSAPITKTGMCRHCGELVEASMWKRIFRNGAIGYCRICPVCHRSAPFGGNVWIPKLQVNKIFTPEQIDEFPIIAEDAIKFCVVCGNGEVELHHWAPKSMFKEDAEKWPKDVLCKNCHAQWHKIVTPGLTWA